MHIRKYKGFKNAEKKKEITNLRNCHALTKHPGRKRCPPGPLKFPTPARIRDCSRT